MEKKANSNTKEARLLHLHPEKHSSLFACENLKILFMRGNGKERARLHGELLDKQMSTEVLRYFSAKAREPIAAIPKPLSVGAERLFLAWIKSLHAEVPLPVQEEVRALAEASGFSLDEIRMAISAPDLGTLSNAWQLSPAMAWVKMRFGCTTVSGTNEKGDFALARNLDFAGVGRFDANPAVFVHLPDDPGELKRVAIGADGVHFASVSGVNEAGIGIVIHQNFTREISAQATPLLLIGDWILRHARSLDQALEILKKFPPGPMWTFVMFDLHSKETVSVEVSRGRFGIRRMENGLIAQTNHCLSAEAKGAQFSALGTYMNSCRRLETALSLAKTRAKDDLAGAFGSILGSSGLNKTDDLPGYDAILKPITIQSMVFEKAATQKGLGKLWITCDPAPASTGRYIGLDLDLLFAGDITKAPMYDIREFAPVSDEVRKRQMRLSEATRLSFDEKDDAEAFDLIADEKGPSQLLLSAVLAYRTKNYQQSLERSEEGLKISKPNGTPNKIPDYIRESFMWVRTLSLLKMNRLQEAKSAAAELMRRAPINRTIASAAEKLAHGKRLRAHETNLIFDFSASDLVSVPQAP